VALGYYLAGSLPIVAAVLGYWETTSMAVLAWLTASICLSVPWRLAANSWGTLVALALTALPPLGVIGWLSPLNAAGVLYPGTGWLGLCLLLTFFAAVHWRCALRQSVLSITLGIALGSNLFYQDPVEIPGWIGVDTSVNPSRGNALMAIENNQSLVTRGRRYGQYSRVVIFPEAVLDDWLPGTRQQFSLSVPAREIWILGAQANSFDAVVRVAQDEADTIPLTRSAGLVLGGNWLPWSDRSLRAAWWEHVALIDGKRAWAALCIEQLQPWTWLEAMIQRPQVILAMSNGWWVGNASTTLQPLGNAALSIERSSTHAWARLMGLPVVWATNR
jgi:hypothetical protein